MQPYNPFAAEETTEMAPAEPEAPAPVEDSGMSPVYSAVVNALDELAAEIRRSIDYFRNKGGDVSTILLCGGGSKIQGLAPFVQSALSLPTEMADPTRNISVQSSSMDPGQVDRRKAEFVTAIGNALHIFY